MIPGTIFLVDNCLLNRMVGDIYFSKNKYQSWHIFDNANDCIKALENASPEIIISDIDLPVLNGIEETKIIKSNHPEIKIIISSSREDSSSVLASLSNGASAYISKRKRGKLKYAIDKILKNEFYMDLRTAKNTFSKIPYSKTTPQPAEENLKLKESLTKREIEVLKLLIDGKTNTQIAETIIISKNTAKAHVGSIFSKLSVKDRVQAAVKAVKANIL